MAAWYVPKASNIGFLKKQERHPMDAFLVFELVSLI